MSVLADPVGDSNLDTAIPVANTAFRDAEGRPRTNDADFIAAARSDVPALLAEVERLTRIVNGYARTPVEQRATDAEAEVGVGDSDHPSDPADCPVCRHALGLPEPATLVLSPEIWCDVCGAWHIPTSCSTANGAGEARTDPRAANRPGMALGDTPQAEDAGEVQS
jgi:hypothetical protein